jgi:hypothetical protein
MGHNLRRTCVILIIIIVLLSDNNTCHIRESGSLDIRNVERFCSDSQSQAHPLGRLGRVVLTDGLL